MAMFQGWRKSGNDRFKIQRTKEKLLEELSKSVKELQKHALNGGCFDISRNDESAFYLTNVLEAIFLHGHQSSISVSGIFSKSSSSGALPSPNFWSILHPFTHKDVLHQLNHLSHITTLVGKCRAWLRLALNDCLMESYFHAILLDKKKLSHHYSPKAFLRDDEATSIMLNHFLGLIEFHFDLNYNTPSLNQWAVPALQLSGTWEPPTVPSATVATHSAGVRRPLSVHKAAIQSNPKAPAPSLTRSPKEQTLSDEMASYTSDTVMDYSGPEDENVKDKSAVDIDTTRTHGEKDFAKQNQPDNLGASPAIEACTTPSPVNHRGGNMLSMASGWSSSFEEEPSDQTAAAHVKNPAPDSEAKPMKPVMSFHGILSDYAMTGSKKFGSKGLATHLYSSPEEQDSLQEIDQSYCKEAFAPEKSSGFEIIADYSTPEEGYLNQRNVALLASVNDIPREKGLDRQDYKCKGCSRPIGMIYGQFKVCSYDGSYYCYECHVDDEHVIPARIIHNWDLTKYKVAKHVKLFLMQIDEEPLFHIDEVNPTLYNVISEINKAKHLRIQLQHLKGYVMTCRNTMVAEDVKRRMWPREYLWDDIHQYSLLDLIQVNSGLLQHHLKKIISFCKKHVYGCEVCSQKGFICEICKNSKIVYAFELNYTAQCPRCKAVFHKFCKVDRQCPRCTRRRSRRQPPEDATTENGHYNPGLNSLF